MNVKAFHRSRFDRSLHKNIQFCHSRWRSFSMNFEVIFFFFLAFTLIHRLFLDLDCCGLLRLGLLLLRFGNVFFILVISSIFIVVIVVGSGLATALIVVEATTATASPTSEIALPEIRCFYQKIFKIFQLRLMGIWTKDLLIVRKL